MLGTNSKVEILRSRRLIGFGSLHMYNMTQASRKNLLTLHCEINRMQSRVRSWDIAQNFGGQELDFLSTSSY
jgi:hypothetical protein